MVVAATGAENWPGFRGSKGGVGGGATPSAWNIAQSQNVAWKTPIAGTALSSPIIWENRIYVTTSVPLESFQGQEYRKRHAWKVLSVDRATGKVLWETAAHEATPFMQRHPKSSYANATPATDGKHVVALFGTEALVCLDSNGKVLWKKTLEMANSRPDGFHVGTSPVIVEDLVVLQDDRDKNSYVAAYRLRDGSEAWKVARDEGPAQSTPAVTWLSGASRRPLVVLAGAKSVLALDGRTGKEVWRLNSNTQAASASAVIADDVVVFAGGGSKKPVYAVRAASSGDISLAMGQSNNAGVIWSTERGGSYIPSPLVVNGQAYVLGDNGVLAAYNINNGRQLFQERAGTGEFYASPVTADGKIYVVNTDGDVTVLRAGPAFEVLARNSFGEPTSATPAIADGTIYVRTAGHLIALRESAATAPRR